MIKLFIGGFPLGISELELVQLVSPYTTVSTIKIVRDKVTKKCKGYAFLEVSDTDSAKAAIEALDGSAIGDRILTLNIVTEKQIVPKRQPSYPKVPATAIPFKKKRPRRIV